MNRENGLAKNPVKLNYIFCDESRQTADRYMVLGGIIVSSGNTARFKEAMKLYRDSQRMHATLKWTKVSDQKLKEYRALIDLFFSFTGLMHFKCMVIDTAFVDYRKYHKGDRELGFYKFMYQFLLNQFGPYARDDRRYVVVLHRRTTKYSLSVLCNVLNNGLRTRYGLRERVVRKVEPRPCENEDLLQVAGLLMGAVGYHWNNCHTRTNAKRAKVLLAEYIADRIGLLSLAQQTPRGKKEFSIWQMKLRK